jgi:hypothetical protein
MVKAGAFFVHEADVHQKEMGQESLGHVMMPATPGAGLVVVHADFPLAFFKGSFDRLAHPAQAHELTRGTGACRIAQVMLGLCASSAGYLPHPRRFTKSIVAPLNELSPCP